MLMQSLLQLKPQSWMTHLPRGAAWGTALCLGLRLGSLQAVPCSCSPVHLKAKVLVQLCTQACDEVHAARLHVFPGQKHAAAQDDAVR